MEKLSLRHYEHRIDCKCVDFIHVKAIKKHIELKLSDHRLDNRHAASMLIALQKEVADKGLPERLLLQIKHFKEQNIASQQYCNLSVVFRKRCKSDTLIGITWPQASGKTKPYYNSIHD